MLSAEEKPVTPPSDGSSEEFSAITPAMERHNRWIFATSFALTYFGAPIFFVGVVQAALCNRLGASAAIANLPAAGYNFGFFAPMLAAVLIPSRLEKRTIVIACSFVAAITAACSLSLILPLSDSLRIATVVSQGTLTGFADSIATVYKYQCLGRGTTTEGRSKVLKITFTLGPLCAVAGSLTAQYILNNNRAWLQYPRNFAVLYAIAAVAVLGVGILSSQYQLAAIHDEERQPFTRAFGGALRGFMANRNLRILWLSSFFWSCTWNAIPSLSLYTRHVLGNSPEHISGLILAVRFGCKSFMGLILGSLAIRFGIRAPLLAATLLSALGILWVWAAPGYLFLIAFGLMGAGELGTPYYNNYTVSVSPAADGAKNLALINLSPAAAAASPVIYGLLIDHLGFSANFMAGVGVGSLAFATLFFLPAGTPDWKRILLVRSRTGA